VNPPGWRLGFFAAQNSYACASGPVILHRMWVDGTEFKWSMKKAAA
jgi:hypothetical protein